MVRKRFVFAGPLATEQWRHFGKGQNALICSVLYNFRFFNPTNFTCYHIVVFAAKRIGVDTFLYF